MNDLLTARINTTLKNLILGIELGFFIPDCETCRLLAQLEEKCKERIKKVD